MAKISRENHTRTVLDRRSEGGRCELHGGMGHEIHHRNKQGRVWTPSNCLRLCRGCHSWIEANPAHAMALGLWVPREVEPSSVPAFCKPVLFALGWWQPLDNGTWAMDTYGPPPDRETHGALVEAEHALRIHLASVGALS